MPDVPPSAPDWIADLRWIFFDVGNVLVSDDPSGCFCYRALHEALAAAGAPEPAADFFSRRTAYMTSGNPGGLWGFVASHAHMLPEGDWKAFQQRTRAALYDRWPEHSPEIPGMHAVVEALAHAGRSGQRRWRLGLLANQPRQVEGLLRDRELWDLFDLHGVSETVGLEKPDPEFFQWALREAGLEAEPHRSLMVGDRPDNDIIPARRVGMHTLLLSLGPAGRAWQPPDSFSAAYADALLEHNISDLGPRTPEEQPDLIARTPEEMLHLLLGPNAANV